MQNLFHMHTAVAWPEAAPTTHRQRIAALTGDAPFPERFRAWHTAWHTANRQRCSRSVLEEQRMVTRAARVALFAMTAFAAAATVANAQPQEPETRQAVVEQAQREKVDTLHPYEPDAAERVFSKFDDFISRAPKWHPFFDSAYSGGGFTLGAGYRQFVSSFNSVDVRGSYTIRGYKRAEAEFVAPHLFHRRGELSVVGGWREATQVDFYGYGTDSSKENGATYGFQQPYGSALLTVRPTRRFLLARGGFELSEWSLNDGTGGGRTVDDVYTPASLPGLGTKTTYLHTQGTIGFDWRQAAGYARRGGFYGITAHDYTDPDERFGFRQVDYEVIQHLPILREAWVLSLRGLAETTLTKDGQAVPYFMLPSLGGGSNLRGYSSWRFRDRNSLLVQVEWRIMVNRFLDTAVFYDAGQVAAKPSHLDLSENKRDFGFGARFHTPFSTPLRIDVAKSDEGLRIVFATSPVF
jgi:hypothetical protein